VNLIRLHRPASLRALLRSLSQDLEGSSPSVAARRLGPLADRPEQRQSLNGTKCRGWGGGVVEDRRVGREHEGSRETHRDRTEFMAARPEEPPGGSQSVHRSEEAG
jgi:hypothetical protein